MTVKLPVNITKAETSVYLCNDTDFRQKPSRFNICEVEHILQISRKTKFF